MTTPFFLSAMPNFEFHFFTDGVVPCVCVVC